MALIKNSITLSHRAARRGGFVFQKDHNGRTVVSHWKKRKAPGKPPGSLFPFSNIACSAAVYNRSFLRTYSGGYDDFLTPAQQLAWHDLSVAHAVMTEDGAIKSLTGKQLYDWWSALQYFWSGPCACWDSLHSQFIWTDPPAVWDPPATPYDITVDFIDDHRIRLDFYSTPNLSLDNGYALISAQNPLTRSREVKHFVRANFSLGGVDPSVGHYNMDVWLAPTYTNAAQLRNPSINIRLMSDLPNLVPSDWAGIIVP